MWTSLRNTALANLQEKSVQLVASAQFIWFCFFILYIIIYIQRMMCIVVGFFCLFALLLLCYLLLLLSFTALCIAQL